MLQVILKKDISTVEDEFNKDSAQKDYFVILMGAAGKSFISLENGNSENLNQEETLLKLASVLKIKIKKQGKKFLEVSV